MNAKSFLQQYDVLNTQLKQLESEINAIRTDAERMNAVMDGMPKQTGKSDRVGNVAVRLADKQLDYQMKLLDLWAKREEIVSVISKMDKPIQMRLLYDRYIRLMQWKEVANDIHAAEEYTRGRLHGMALQNLEMILNKIQKVT